ncbi:MAG: SDR family oxidoreductase [candidate division Zixibacteria bacterium]|nr:SDR family oxidoreductase [candidate division Zixibacteria bacterium]
MNRFNQIIFLTGATGNLGSKLVLQVLEEKPNTQIIALVRGKNQFDAESRLKNLLLRLSPNSNFSDIGERLEVINGDITKRQLGLPYSQYINLGKKVTHIIHSAAATKFSSTLEESRHVNCTGTKNVMRFAGLASESSILKTVSHISTAYVCGNREGIILEDETDKSCSFSNGYEQSKWEAEQFVRGLMRQIPITIFRPSIIVGDSETGHIATFNVLYPPLKLLCQGKMILLPGCSEAPLDVIPVDYAAGAILHITLNNNNSNGKTFHIVAGKNNSSGVGQIIRQARNILERENPDTTVVNTATISSNSIWNRFSTQAKNICKITKFLNIYRPYITLNRYFDDTNTRRVLRGSGVSAPSLINYLDKIMKYSIGTNWGKNRRSAA